jgi:hypothetical protein
VVNLSLKDKAKALNASGGISFMDERTKGELPEGVVVTINDFGFIKGDKGEFVVISLEEHPEEFFFGGGVVTEKLRELKDDLDDVQNEGLPVVFHRVKNKKGKREYMTCEFYPNEV